MKYLIAVGACYLDTILSVPYYPGEDEKLRATTLSKRRGGNCPNTLEVLQQLVLESGNHRTQEEEEQISHPEKKQPLKLILSSVLPSSSSSAYQFIVDSFSDEVVDSRSHCICRNNHREAASSYIIKSQSTSSRTIVNYNDLPEMSTDEFKQLVDSFLNTHSHDSKDHSSTQDGGGGQSLTDEVSGIRDVFWYHFEGRIPPTIQACMEYLRQHPFFKADSPATLKISVELEKPNRPGLMELAGLADVVFHSKSWAVAQGYETAEHCLKEQAKMLPRAELLVCTWGEEGSVALALAPVSSDGHRGGGSYVRASAFKTSLEETQHETEEGKEQRGGKGIVDTIGAGDTFIAGILWTWLCWSEEIDLKRRLDFANELAGRKIMQEGFDGLGEMMKMEECL